jgi:hypothetical protein
MGLVSLGVRWCTYWCVSVSVSSVSASVSVGSTVVSGLGLGGILNSLSLIFLSSLLSSLISLIFFWGAVCLGRCLVNPWACLVVGVLGSCWGRGVVGWSVGAGMWGGHGGYWDTFFLPWSEVCGGCRSHVMCYVLQGFTCLFYRLHRGAIGYRGYWLRGLRATGGCGLQIQMVYGYREVVVCTERGLGVVCRGGCFVGVCYGGGVMLGNLLPLWSVFGEACILRHVHTCTHTCV